MNATMLLIGLALAVVAALVLSRARSWWRRRQQHAAARTLHIDEALDATLPWRARLTPEQRTLHTGHVLTLLDRVRFYGCDGQTVDEPMRITIAGLGCLLTLHRPQPYPQLRAVLVYPAAFWVRHEEPDEIGLVADDAMLQIGESQQWGRVVLSWQDIQAALRGDAVNVAVHEFAHQLDEEAPEGEGAPAGADARRWPAVMQAAWDELDQRPSPVLDDYALEGPAEFFAVAVESFFQRPDELARVHADLFELLRDTFGVDFRGVAFHGVDFQRRRTVDS